jgi:hypothetical protein
MKILMASTPATGHLNPLLAIGHIWIAEGHEVVGLSGSVLRERIENIGAEIRPLPEGADFDLRDILSVAPELKDMPPGPYRSGGGIRNSLRNFPRNSASGKNFKIMAIDVHTVEDGKIKRTYHLEDWAGAMRQLSGGT